MSRVNKALLKAAIGLGWFIVGMTAAMGVAFATAIFEPCLVRNTRRPVVATA